MAFSTKTQERCLLSTPSSDYKVSNDMNRKLIAALSLALTLTACGGFDDMDAARLGMSGIGNTVTEPSNPVEKTQWQYSSTANNEGVYSLRANNYALNSFYDPKMTELKHTPSIQLEKRKSSSGAVRSSLVIFAYANLSCTPSCKVAMSFDGNRATYEMRNIGNGAIVPINDFTENQLFNKFTTSNKAIISLPIIGLPQVFDANFDLRGYELNKMRF